MTGGASPQESTSTRLKRRIRFYIAMIFYYLLLLPLPLLLATSMLRAQGSLYTNFPPVQVTAERLDTSSGRGWNSGTLLERVPLVSSRQQGIDGASGDISVRGGSFNSSGILLQGIALRNPQTEHLQGDLFIPSKYLQPIAIVTGTERLLRSANHSAGAAVMDLAPLSRTGELSLGAGQASSYNTKWRQDLTPLDSLPELGLSFFGGFDRTDRTDRHPDNNLESWSAGGRLEMIDNDAVYNLLWLTARRDFGARGFYGTPTSLPSKERVKNSLVMGSYERGQRDDLDYDRLALAFNRIGDSYWYYGKTQDITSRHRSETATLHSEHSRPINEHLSLAIRGEIGSERLRSGSLGDHSRTRSSFALLPAWQNDRWILRSGGAWELFENDKPAWLPAAGIAYKLPRNSQIFIDYSEAISLPSYTEYNYNNPTSLGNQGLKRQQTRLLEGGIRRNSTDSDLEITAFAEFNRNSVDWLILEESHQQFQATNLHSLRRTGLAGLWRRKIGRSLEVRTAGLMQRAQTDQTYHASRYLLDTVRSDIKLDFIWHIGSAYRLDIWQHWQQMPANPLRTSGRDHWLTGIEASWRPHCKAGMRLALGITNLLNDDFEPFIGQPEAERRAYFRAEMIF